MCCGRRATAHLLDPGAQIPLGICGTLRAHFPGRNGAIAFGRVTFNRRSNDGRFGIWTMRADGSNAVRHTFGVFDVFPDWRPR
jgi:hypothetical protein